MGYRKTNEMHYYGSDLNKYLSESDLAINGRRTQTINNIDCLQYKMIGNKRILRIIESKKWNEPYGANQLNALKMLAFAFKAINKMPSNYEFQIYTVYGNPPYYQQVKVIDHLTEKEHLLNNKEFIAFTQFRKKL